MKELRGGFFVGWSQFDAYRVGCPGAKKFDLHGADTTADLENGPALRPVSHNQIDDAPGRGVQAFHAIASRRGSGSLLTKDAPVADRAAAVTHAAEFWGLSRLERMTDAIGKW